MIFKRYGAMLKNEFSGYNLQKLIKDMLAGLTVAAVSLPLALAFGVASGADAASGLITAIIAGIVIGIVGGASYQISGPTGAMTAVLTTLVATFGMQGVFLSCLLAGVILLVCGIFKIGKIVQFIPRPVIVGFTSGIAIIIMLGQIDNFFGTTSVGLNIFEKFASYGELGFAPNWLAVLCGVLVIVIMSVYPKKWNAKVPSSLVSIIIVGILSYVCKFDVAVVGDIPRTLIHSTRINFGDFDFSNISELLSPAITIAALGMVESLLCGTCASNMSKKPFDANMELIGQGIGNIAMPFFGGVPATAAIARTSVAIKSGGITRLTSVFHSIWLIICMFLLTPIMGKLPLSALAGVLIMTAVRMNEWSSIKYFFKNKMWSAVAKFAITMVATVIFDLTVAIVIGVVFALILMMSRMTKLSLETSELKNTLKPNDNIPDTICLYITGAVFFANIGTILNKIRDLARYDRIVIVMRGVNYFDVSACQELHELLKGEHKEIILTGVNDDVKKLFDKSGISDIISNNYYNTLDQYLQSDILGK